ncbi:uracil-DNA glycosylase [Halioglobus maricola]|uniref:Uracil-DNA glycosylase n=2 Tax=Halioglobus maricola TaxID=2601894 RepID=A0A5P9NQ43_9GAMM|nr:uracil-DNA glycosylase [Halioglobus maricola]QFU77892.1 uracil-DNA glycosylase [Halioglobus maricola]
MGSQLESSWMSRLGDEFAQPYMQALCEFLQAEEDHGKRIFPPRENFFRAFTHTPLPAVKVVILGQDPYHGENQAHGLSFSVPPGVKVPPSLRNIYKELNTELGLPVPAHGYLSAWAEQGVLLLNSVLSVECGQAASHRGKGWETFTDRVIEVINRDREGVVFMLWGGYAQSKGAKIDTSRHCVLQAPHPSPLSAHRGFFGCGHFAAANDYLQSRGDKAVDWSLPPVA